jgi:DNA (cytosine-5)-methyltransferase 1
MVLFIHKRVIKENMKYHYIDLFSGIGGFALGARWAGIEFESHYNSDIDNYANLVYSKHFPEAIQLGDITKIRTEELPKNNLIISGGFPCQDISIEGKGEGIYGKRSGLWFEYWRIIRALRPRFAIMENVGAITFRGLDRVLGSLAEIGYDAEWQDIRASDIGAPHKRERIWIVAYPGLPESSGRDEVNKRGEGKKRGKSSSCGADVSDSASKGLQGQKSTWRDGRESGLLAKCCKWSAEPDVGRVANGVPRRVDRLKCLGNSIVPQIACFIFSRIKDIE